MCGQNQEQNKKNKNKSLFKIYDIFQDIVKTFYHGRAFSHDFIVPKHSSAGGSGGVPRLVHGAIVNNDHLEVKGLDF